MPGCIPASISGDHDASGIATTRARGGEFGCSSRPSPKTPGRASHRTVLTSYPSAAAIFDGRPVVATSSRASTCRRGSTTPRIVLRCSRFASTDRTYSAGELKSRFQNRSRLDAASCDALSR